MKLSIRVYDNANTPTPTADHYTIVFHGRYRHLTGGRQEYIGCSGAPFHPQGIGYHGDAATDIDYPSYRHLGKKLNEAGRKSLPDDVKTLIKQTAREYFDPKLYSVTESELKNIVDLGHVSFSKNRPTRRSISH